MSQPLVERTSQGGVRVLTVHNPPVNVLSPGVPEALIAGLREANADPSVRAVVLAGAGAPLSRAPTLEPSTYPPKRSPTSPPSWPR